MTQQQSSALILTSCHSTAMATLYQACFSKAWSTTFFATTLNETGQGYGIVQGQHLVGFILGHVIKEEAEIITLCVHEKHRNQGMGTLLLHTFLNSSKCHKCFLEVSLDNKPAQSLYKNLGFKQIAVRKGYYALHPHQRQDALVMQWTKAPLDLL